MIDAAPDGVVLTLKVIPRAGRTMLAGVRDRALLLRLAAPPVEGAANSALIGFLADALRVARRDIQLLSGETSRTKRVKVMGVSAAIVRERLGLSPDAR